MQKSTKEIPDKKSTSTAKKTVDKKASDKKGSDSSIKKASAKKASTKIPTAKSKATSTKTKTKSKSASKTVSSAKRTTSSRKKNTTKRATSKKAKKLETVEYYDLPYRYNQTVVRILAQTPTTLFVYWDISDDDRQKYINQFGENFFEETTPILIVHNKTMNYSFEIEINDFANSWYFNVDNVKCNYEIELGRKAKVQTINLPNDYLQIASSNNIEAPNNHILFEKNQKALFFKNVKTNEVKIKELSHLSFMKYVGRIYNIYDLYKKIYKNEELQDLEKNPSSTF